jgi:hypothetical protein
LLVLVIQLEALEQAGTAESRRVLRGLAEGAAVPWLAEEAKAALERLAARASAAP